MLFRSFRSFFQGTTIGNVHAIVLALSFCSLAQVGMVVGAGRNVCWRRWEKDGGTCSAYRQWVASVGAGPHRKSTSAPKNRGTCARIPIDLRQCSGASGGRGARGRENACSKVDRRSINREEVWGSSPGSPLGGSRVSGGGVIGPLGHQKRPLAAVFFACPKPGSNRHVFKGHWILSPARLPIPPFGQGTVSVRDGLQIYRIF